MPSEAQKLWNSGASKEEFAAVGLSAEHDKLKERYGCASIPVRDLLQGRRKTQKETDAMNNIGVGQGKMTYGDWKGTTGSGKQLKDMIAQERTNGNNIDANAAHIVKCVNVHDELVETLEDHLKNLIESVPYRTGYQWAIDLATKTIEAIKKAKGEE